MNPVKVRNLTIGEGMPKVCAPIVGKTKSEIIEAARLIVQKPIDMAEWRADWYDSVFEIQKVVEVAKELRDVLGELPILFTFRTKSEGGEKELDEKPYAMLNKLVVSSGYVDMVDVEVFSAGKEVQSIIEAAHQTGVKVVGSYHDFEQTPDEQEIINRLSYMQEIGVDILKIAVMPNSLKDVLTLMSATAEMKEKYADRPIATMSMSSMGVISRLCGEVFGSAITFGAVDQASAPGQIKVEDMRNILEILHKNL